MNGEKAAKYGAIAVLAVAAITLIAWLAWPSPEVDIPGIEQEVAAGIEDQTTFRNVTVDCPDTVKWETGEDFNCFATDGTGQVRVKIYMETDEGDVSWVIE